VQGLGFSRRLFFKFRGFDLMLYKDRPSLGLLDFAFRARGRADWQIVGRVDTAPPVAVGLAAGVAGGFLYLCRSLRTGPIQESELVRSLRFKQRKPRRPKPRSRLSRLGGVLEVLLRESFGFVVQWRREIRSARRTVEKWFGRGIKK
jgi:hypothetical protein